jgi:hypothetical protein
MFRRNTHGAINILVTRPGSGSIDIQMVRLGMRARYTRSYGGSGSLG